MPRLEQDRRIGRGESEGLADRRLRRRRIVLADRQGSREIPIKGVVRNGLGGLLSPGTGGHEIALSLGCTSAVKERFTALLRLEFRQRKRLVEIEGGFSRLVGGDPKIASRCVQLRGLGILVGRGLGSFIEALCRALVIAALLRSERSADQGLGRDEIWTRRSARWWGGGGAAKARMGIKLKAPEGLQWWSGSPGSRAVPISDGHRP